MNDVAADEVTTLARRALDFEQRVSADLFVAPGLPLYDLDLDAWLNVNDQILAVACSINGAADLDRRPMLALVVPTAADL